MSKSIKFFAMILIIFSMLISFYSVYATSIDMNLVANDTVDENTVVSDNAVNDDISSQMPNNSGEITSPSSVSATQEEGLGFTNILNILLITVGVILILLSIAIIIRLK